MRCDLIGLNFEQAHEMHVTTEVFQQRKTLSLFVSLRTTYTPRMKIIIGCDHAGLPLKNYLMQARKDIEWIDVGTYSESSVDYPDIADLAVKNMITPDARGVLICGSGQGMAMRANKFQKIRAALCWDTTSAKLSREHNNSNMLCMGARLLPFGLALDILDVWLKTEFFAGRHATRVEKVNRT
jgi:RpiB/LacA/LacB family sugar-phosphate isomerase